MAIKLDGPIPGQSLTRELGNAPWEQPPLYPNVEKALAFHLERMGKGTNMEDLLFLLDQGFPISTFVDSLTTKAVMEGYHTIDVSQLIAPVIHTYIKEAAQSAGVKYTEFDGPTEEERMKERYKKQLSIKIANNLPLDKTVPMGAAQPFIPPMAENPMPQGQSGPTQSRAEMATGGPVTNKMDNVDSTGEPPAVQSLGPNQGYIQRRK